MSPAALSDESNQESGRKRDAEHTEMLRNLQEHEKQLGVTHEILRNAVSQLGNQLNAAIEHRTRLESANQIDNARWARQLEEERNRRKRSDETVAKLEEENRSAGQYVENVQIRMRSDIEMRDRVIADASAREEAVRQELLATRKVVEKLTKENNQLKELLARHSQRREQRQSQMREIARCAVQVLQLQSRQQEQLIEMTNAAAADARFLNDEKGKGLAVDEDTDTAMPDQEQQVEGAGPSRRRVNWEDEGGELRGLGWPPRGMLIGGVQKLPDLNLLTSETLGTLGGATGSLNLLASETLGTLSGETGSLHTGNLIASETLGTAAEDGGDFDYFPPAGAHQVAAESYSDSDGRSPLLRPQENNAEVADDEARGASSAPRAEGPVGDEGRARDENGDFIISQVANSDTQPAAGEPPVDFLFAESQSKPVIIDGVVVPPRQAPTPPPVDPRESRRRLLEAVVEMERYDLFEAR